MTNRWFTIILHSLSWLALFGPLYARVWTTCESCSIWFILAHFLVFFAGVYLHLFLLVNRLLIQKRVWAYLTSVILLMALSLFLLAFWDKVKMNEEVVPEQSSVLTYLPMLIAIHVFFLFMHLGLRFFREKRKNEQLEASKMETELALLRAQLNPHFLFNTLNSIYALSLKRSEELPDLILRLSRYLDFAISDKYQKSITLEKELDLIENYAAIELARVGDKVDYKLDVSELKNDRFELLPMMLGTFVENAFKHGVYDSPGRSYVHVKIKSEENYLNFECQNSFEAEHRRKNKGMGLQNIKKQIAWFFKRHSILIEEEDGVFFVKLEVYHEA